jgi:hypothetical protein
MCARSQISSRHTAVSRRAVPVVLLGLAIITSGQAFAQTASRGTESQAAAPPSCPGWNLAAEFRLFPNQANPNPDNCGNANVWYFMESRSLARDPLTYSLLPEFITDAFFIPGMQQWQDLFNCSGNCNDKLPAVGINATDTFRDVGGILWPAGVIRIHPMTSQLVIVGWRSPINGPVRVLGAFTDIDASCGDGASWSIDQGTTTLANGSFLDGGAQSFQLSDISVSQGDFLYFTVHPKSDNRCDSTRLDVTIALTKRPIAIDIKPRSFPNSINPKSKGVIPVAILTTATFDAGTVDPTTVRFGANGTEAAPVHSALEDVDGDADIDMILHFRTQQTGIRCGDISAPLTAKTTGGQAVEGSDSVKTVGCKT